MKQNVIHAIIDGVGQVLSATQVEFLTEVLERELSKYELSLKATDEELWNKENADRTHFLTKRFDRANGKKLHTQTLCGIAHYDFRLHRAYSYEQVFSVMRSLRLPYSEAEEMFRRIVFNVVARNQDDHTKNVSFLMDESGSWRLSPAYDMLYAYNPDGRWTSTHQMSVNGKFDGITHDDLLRCGEQNNIRSAASIIDECAPPFHPGPPSPPPSTSPSPSLPPFSPTCCLIRCRNFRLSLRSLSTAINFTAVNFRHRRCSHFFRTCKKYMDMLGDLWQEK